MRLLVKFSLLFILLFGSGLVLAGYYSYQFLQSNARDQVLQQAQLMMETSLSMRNYTTKQLKPLLVQTQQHLKSFLPQTVPAFAATENFNAIRGKYPLYTYKEATLNPTNLRDRAVEWESDIITTFRNHPDRKEVSGERQTPDGRSLYLARPITAGASCLECHSTPDRAPVAMIKTYGSANGFGWGLNEVIGAQIVSVPMSLPIGNADRAFRSLIIYLVVVALITMFMLDLALVVVVVRPVSRMAKAADEISKGNLEVEELPVKGKDEISVLAKSFNRMYVSIAKAIRMLENE